MAQVATHYGIIDRGSLVKQLSAEELVLKSRQHIRITTKDSARALALLKENFGVTDYQAVFANELWIREQIDRTREMNTLLVRHGIVVESIAVTEQRLEEYFVNLTGGIKS